MGTPKKGPLILSTTDINSSACVASHEIPACSMRSCARHKQTSKEPLLSKLRPFQFACLPGLLHAPTNGNHLCNTTLRQPSAASPPRPPALSPGLCQKNCMEFGGFKTSQGRIFHLFILTITYVGANLVKDLTTLPYHQA